MGFGIIVPLLGIIISIHITVMVIQHDIFIGRHFSSSNNPDSDNPEHRTQISTNQEDWSFSQAFMIEVRSIWRGPYLLANYIIVIVVMLMGCFLLDQASDRDGWRQGVWVVPSLFVTCVPAWLLWRYQPSWKDRILCCGFGSSSVSEEDKEFHLKWGSMGMLDVSHWLSLVEWLLSFDGRNKTKYYERLPLQDGERM